MFLFKFGPVTSITGTYNVITGRVFVAYEEKLPALRDMPDMLISKPFHLLVKLIM